MRYLVCRLKHHRKDQPVSRHFRISQDIDSRCNLRITRLRNAPNLHYKLETRLIAFYPIGNVR